MRVLTDSAHDVAVAKSPLHSLTQRCKKTWDRDLWCAPFENREECGSLDGVGEERVGQPPALNAVGLDMNASPNMWRIEHRKTPV